MAMGRRGSWRDPGTSRIVLFVSANVDCMVRFDLFFLKSLILKLLYVVFLDSAFSECLTIHYCRSPDLCSNLGQ